MRDTPVNVLLQIIDSDHFNIGLFKSTFKQTNDWKDVTQRDEKRAIIENNVQNYTLQKHVEHLTELAVHCKRDVITVLQEQVSLATFETDFIFRTIHDSSNCRV